MAIEASVKEKQREDRRNRLRLRGTRAEEEEQCRLMAECQDMAAVLSSESDKEGEREVEDTTEEMKVGYIVNLVDCSGGIADSAAMIIICCICNLLHTCK